MNMQQSMRRGPAAVVFLALLGMLVSACSGPVSTDAVSAATINGTTITMTQFQAMTRLIIGVDQISGSPNGTAIGGWQQQSGKTELVKAQQQVLALLITNMVLDNTIHKNVKLYAINLADLKTQEDAKVVQFFSSVPVAFQPLVDQGLLTTATYRPFVYQQLAETALTQSAGLTFSTAHIKILTVQSQKTADALMQQLENGADWTTLALKNSIDPAKSAGGDIASLVPHFLPASIDQVVFGKSATLNKIAEVHSRLGWSLVEPLTVTNNVLLSKLDNTVPIIPNATVSAANAAVNGYLNNLANQMNIAINVNWCNDSSGQNCNPIFPPDQM